MASPFSKSKSLRNTRSISLPCRSHPTTERIEEELNKLRAWEISLESSTTSPSSSSDAAEEIGNCLVGLSELQKCVNDLLHLPQTLQALSKHSDAKWAEEMLEDSVKILDICGVTGEMVLQLKECVWDLQSFLRRRKGEVGREGKVNKFNSLRKKMKQEAKRLVGNLRKMEQEIPWNSEPLESDSHFCAVIRALRESFSVTNILFQRTLNFLSALISNPKPSKWALVSRLLLKQEQENSSNKIDVFLCGLDRLGAQFEGIENGLEGTFRSLIRSRSSLLNVISCH